EGAGDGGARAKGWGWRSGGAAPSPGGRDAPDPLRQPSGARPIGGWPASGDGAPPAGGTHRRSPRPPARRAGAEESRTADVPEAPVRGVRSAERTAETGPRLRLG